RLVQARGACETDRVDNNGKSIWQIPGICCQSDSLLTDILRGLGELVTDLMRADRIQLLQDTLIVKPPRIGAPVELHQDYTYIGFLEPANAISLRLSLTPSTVDTGCL